VYPSPVRVVGGSHYQKELVENQKRFEFAFNQHVFFWISNSELPQNFDKHWQIHEHHN
jgi:hypothetical protein